MGVWPNNCTSIFQLYILTIDIKCQEFTDFHGLGSTRSELAVPGGMDSAGYPSVILLVQPAAESESAEEGSSAGCGHDDMLPGVKSAVESPRSLLSCLVTSASNPPEEAQNRRSRECPSVLACARAFR